MALPKIEVQVTADTAQATVNLDRFNDGLSETSAKASGVTAPLKTAKAQVDSLGRSMKASSAHTTNLMFQFQDIGMMLAAGQSPLMLAMQQGTQVSGVFQQMKNSGQSAFKGIVGGLAAMASPMSLMTIGVIAGGAALVQWAVGALSAGEEADEFAKRLDAARESSANLNLELRQMRLGVTSDELAIMDAIATKTKEVADAEERLLTARGQNKRAASQNLKEAVAELSVLKDQLSTIQSQQSEKARLQSSARALADAEREIWAVSQNVSKEAERLVAQLGYAGVKALVLAGVDITSPIFSATQEAARLAGNLGIALNAAMSLQNLQSSMEYSGRGGDPRKFGDPFGRDGGAGTGNLGKSAQDLINASLNKGSAGGGAGSATDPNQARIESLVDSLKTERETVDEWRAEGMDLLAMANEAELAALGGHNEAKLRLEKEYQSKLKGIKDEGLNGNLAIMKDFFGEGAQLMQSGNEKLFQIGKAFAIAEAVVSGISSAQAAWEKGMQAGGPPLAAAYTALSVANSAARISALKSASSSGGGGSGGGAGAASTPQGASQQPLDVRVSGLSSGQLMDGMDVGRLLERLQDEAGDRGLRITVAR